MAISYGFLSTYTPTECGLATFTAALAGELRTGPPAGYIGVVRVVDQLPGSARPEIVHHLVTSSPGGEAEAAAILDGFDAVVVQHEYGIYGGPDGDQVLSVLERLTVPVIVVLHTVLVDPTPHQREVLERVLAAADAVVTMTPTARRRLLHGYPVDPARVTLIPHGAADNRRPPGERPARPTILTWGLLGPGKGIEWVVDALAELRDLEPEPRYLVLGETHPRVVERDGESYRLELIHRAGRRDVAHLVEFDDRYLSIAALGRLVAGADVVILPYDSREQVTSGVLVEALASGKPVIATGFPHAVEMLGGGAGLIVPHGDSAAMAAALRRVLTEPGLAARLGAEAAALAPQLLWPAVADRYRALAGELVEARDAAVAEPPFDHLLRLSDDTGVLEHARGAVPRRQSGYCTDDAARALVVISRQPSPPAEVAALGERCLAFLVHAQAGDGASHNRLGYDRRWEDHPGLGDCWGRSLWGSGTAAARGRSARLRADALVHFEAGAACRSPSPRAMAFAALGAAEVLSLRSDHAGARDLLKAAGAALSGARPDETWPWPEPRLAYANARWAEGLLAAGSGLDDDRLVDEGLRLLEWLLDVETTGDHFSLTPVGGWGPGEPRPGFDQQPIEAAALADACARAYVLSGGNRFLAGVNRAVAWFLGANDTQVPMYDGQTGGGYDGLEQDGRNDNQGAESTIALISTLQQGIRLIGNQL